MSDNQLAALVGISILACLLTGAGFRYGKRTKLRHYESALSYAKQRKALPVPPPDAVLRDAAYLVRRHLDGLPTSRRQAHLPERSWAKAMQLLRQAEIVDAKGKWYFDDYAGAVEMLQAAYRTRAELERKGNFVSPGW